MAFDGFTQFDGAVFPPELRELIPSIKTLAEIKLLLVILDSYFQAGLDAQPMTFDQLEERTNLSRRSVNNGLKALLGKGFIQRLSAGDTYAYEPSLQSKLPCHGSLLSSDSKAKSVHDNMYDHAWESTLYTTLVQEFGVSSRVAEDIARNRDPEMVQRQIDYARYEIKVGFEPQRPAGYVVARIRDDRPPPLGYEGPTAGLPGDPMAGLPPATDGHQRAIDRANGGDTPDPVEEVAKHHYWGFMEAPGIELPGRKRERTLWMKAAERLLNMLPGPYEVLDVCAKLDHWWNDAEQDKFWKDNPHSDKTLILIAKYVQGDGANGSKKRWFTEDEFEQFFFHPDSMAETEREE